MRAGTAASRPAQPTVAILANVFVRAAMRAFGPGAGLTLALGEWRLRACWQRRVAAARRIPYPCSSRAPFGRDLE
jgi:hypothetical protein